MQVQKNRMYMYEFLFCRSVYMMKQSIVDDRELSNNNIVFTFRRLLTN